jgi:hypothetical protein
VVDLAFGHLLAEGLAAGSAQLRPGLPVPACTCQFKAVKEADANQMPGQGSPQAAFRVSDQFPTSTNFRAANPPSSSAKLTLARTYRDSSFPLEGGLTDHQIVALDSDIFDHSRPRSAPAAPAISATPVAGFIIE